MNLKCLLITSILFLTSCQTTNESKNEFYELNYDVCKNILSDKSHRLWKEKEWFQKLTLNNCDLIIFEVENAELI